ncbi:MAG: DinB family protein [bacterium]
MIELAKGVFEQYKTNTRLYLSALEGINREDSLKQIHEKINPIVYIAGHIVCARFYAANLIGLKVAYKYNDICKGGIELVDVNSYPSLDESINDWNEVSEKIFERMGEISEEEFLAEPQGKFPSGDHTIRGGMIFLGSHDMYHIGQLIMLRKALGLKSPIG